MSPYSNHIQAKPLHVPPSYGPTRTPLRHNLSMEHLAPLGVAKVKRFHDCRTGYKYRYVILESRHVLASERVPFMDSHSEIAILSVPTCSPVNIFLLSATGSLNGPTRTPSCQLNPPLMSM